MRRRPWKRHLHPRTVLVLVLAVVATALVAAAPGSAQGCGYGDQQACQKPDVVTGSATGITDTGATLTGQVNPRGRDTAYAFQLSEAEDFSASQVFPNPAQSAGAGNQLVDVSVSASGLKPGTTYYYRLAATNNAGGTFGETKTFQTTSGTGKTTPGVVTGAASGVSSTAATLAGTVNPAGSGVQYAFAYGPTSGYGSKTANKTLPAGTSDVGVTEQLTGLQPGTVYHYRLVAVNDQGVSAIGVDRTFTTAGGNGGGNGGGGGGGNGGGGSDGTDDRVRPVSVSSRARPRRDTTAPYRFRVKGRVVLPASLTALGRAAQSGFCTGKVRITVKQRGRTLMRRGTRLRSDCRYSRRITVRPTGARGKVRLSIRFRGTQELKPRNARSRTVRFGPR